MMGDSQGGSLGFLIRIQLSVRFVRLILPTCCCETVADREVRKAKRPCHPPMQVKSHQGTWSFASLLPTWSCGGFAKSVKTRACNNGLCHPNIMHGLSLRVRRLLPIWLVLCGCNWWVRRAGCNDLAPPPCICTSQHRTIRFALLSPIYYCAVQ
jgi:hypothetical protein